MTQTCGFRKMNSFHWIFYEIQLILQLQNPIWVTDRWTLSSRKDVITFSNKSNSLKRWWVALPVREQFHWRCALDKDLTHQKHNWSFVTEPFNMTLCNYHKFYETTYRLNNLDPDKPFYHETCAWFGHINVYLTGVRQNKNQRCDLTFFDANFFLSLSVVTKISSLPAVILVL